MLFLIRCYQDWLGQNGMADYRKIEAAFHERGMLLTDKEGAKEDLTRALI